MYVMFQQGLFAVSIQNSVGRMEIFQMCLKNASSSTNFLTVLLAKLPVSLKNFLRWTHDFSGIEIS